LTKKRKIPIICCRKPGGMVRGEGPSLVCVCATGPGGKEPGSRLNSERSSISSGFRILSGGIGEHRFMVIRGVCKRPISQKIRLSMLIKIVSPTRASGGASGKLANLGWEKRPQDENIRGHGRHFLRRRIKTRKSTVETGDRLPSNGPLQRL